MSNFRILLSIISAIVLFLYGLGAFSQEIQTVGGETLKKWLGRLTQSRWLAVLLGVLATAIVQSSSAVTAPTVALVDAGTPFGRACAFCLGQILGQRPRHGWSHSSLRRLDHSSSSLAPC